MLPNLSSLRGVDRTPPDQTDGFLWNWLVGSKSKAYEAAVAVRRKSVEGVVWLTTASAVLAARSMIAGIGHAATYAIVRSVVVEMRNRIVNRMGATVFHEHKSTVYFVQMLLSTVVGTFSGDRAKLLGMFLPESAAKSASNSGAIISLFESLEEAFTNPCVRIATDRDFALIMTKEVCDAVLMMLDQCTTGREAWSIEATRSSYPILAHSLVSLGASHTVSTPVIEHFVDAIRKSAIYDLVMQMDPKTGIDSFVASIGVGSRSEILDRIGETLQTIAEALRSYPHDPPEDRYAFRAPDYDKLTRAESFIVAEGSIRREEELAANAPRMDADDEQFWDANDFFVPHDDIDVSVRVEDVDSFRATD